MSCKFRTARGVEKAGTRDGPGLLVVSARMILRSALWLSRGLKEHLQEPSVPDKRGLRYLDRDENMSRRRRDYYRLGLLEPIWELQDNWHFQRSPSGP
jgi:hypothetical protein